MNLPAKLRMKLIASFLVDTYKGGRFATKLRPVQDRYMRVMKCSSMLDVKRACD